MNKLTLALTFLVLGILIGINFQPTAQPIREGQEPVSLQEFKQDKIIFSTKTPKSSDKGLIWVRYTAGSATSMDIYFRHPVIGTWLSVPVS
jgi:hypothetical protein